MDTSFSERCIDTLEKALGLLAQSDPEAIDYEMYRSASVKHPSCYPSF